MSFGKEKREHVLLVLFFME